MKKTLTDTEALARKILLHSRRRISHLAPILLESIYALPEKVRPFPGPLSTDGKTLWFDPYQVVEDFREDRDAVARQLLHVTIHCLLGHLELRDSFPNQKAFDCAADLKASQLAEGLCGSAMAGKNPNSHDSYENMEHLHPLYNTLTTAGDECFERYRRDSLLSAGKNARFDDHNLWSPLVIAAEQQLGGAPTDGDGNGNAQGSGSGDDAPQDGANGEASSGNGPDWNRIRQSMLDGNGGKLPGNCAGLLAENFSVPDRGMSFAEFLKRFASPEERMLLDPDTFDVRWYHLGLEYYGDIPLLEPSELSEPPLPDDIVIALDTSGSCSGEVCRRFLKETLGILRDISAGVSRFRVWLMQCDTQIQSEVLLETPEQVEALFQNFEAHGFGGTDFRPVFRRVEELRQSGALPRVRGLLYLSDGYGNYPDKPTDYPTAFLIPSEDRDYQPRGTEWITRLYLNKTDFTLKEANT